MTTEVQKSGGCWPTPTQELLLKAALLQGKDSLEAWEEWIAREDIEKLDTGSWRMLPLLYRNLSEQGVTHPAMVKLKGVYRYIWCKNQVLFHNMANLLKKFHEAGIETMTLKGSALVLLHYRDYGLRPMDDFDVLVPTAKALRAFDVLKDSGWVPTKEFLSPDRVVSKIHSTPFRCSTQLNLDLHWHVFFEELLEEQTAGTSDAEFWRDSVPARVVDVATRALNPTDQMLHAFVHGIQWNVAPPFRWIADVMAILKTSKVDIDWDRLLSKTKEYRVILPVREGLEYMRKFGVAVPDDAMRAFRETPVTKKEALIYDVITRPYNKYGMNRLSLIWVQYQRYLKIEVGNRLKDRIMSIPNFFKKFWRVENYWEIPVCAVMKLFKRIFQIGYRHSQLIKLDGNKESNQ